MTSPLQKRAKLANDDKKRASYCELSKENCPWFMDDKEKLYEDNFGNRFTVKDTSNSLAEAILEGVLSDVKDDGGYKTPSPKKKKSPPPSELVYKGQMVEMGIESDYPGICEYCKYDPCVIEQYAFEGIDTVHSLEFSGMSANECRKKLYRFYFLSMYGPAGKGNRTRLPACVVAKVRELFPSGNGEYMGFKQIAEAKVEENLALAENAVKDIDEF